GADDFAQRPIDVIRGDDVVAGLESLNDRGGDGESGREDQGFVAAFEVGEALLKHQAVGVVFSRVAEAAGIRTIGIAFEGGGEMNGSADGAGSGVSVAAGMNRAG